MYTHSPRNGKPNNIKVFVSKKTKELKRMDKSAKVTSARSRLSLIISDKVSPFVLLNVAVFSDSGFG